jgi:hypothetical protein
MSVANKISEHLKRQADVVKKFITTPMGVYEFADEIIRNRRTFIMETIRAKRGTLPTFSKQKILRG